MTTFTKEDVLALVTVVTGFFSFWLWKEAMPLLQAGALTHAESFIAPLATLILTASLFMLASMLVTRAWLRATVAIATVSAPFLLAIPSLYALPLIPVSALLALFAVRRMRKEHELSLGFSTTKIAKAGLPMFFTVASILAAWFYFQTMQDQQKAVSALVPRPITDLMIRVLAEPLKEITGLPEIRADMTVDELLAASIRRELGENGVKLTSDGERGITELLAHQRDAFAKQYGITLQGDERVGDVMHRAIIERLGDVLGPFVTYLPFLSSLAFFFAFKAFTFPVYLLSVAATALLIRALRTATIVKSESRQIMVERLTL